MFEFVAAGTNAPTCAFFETCMYRAMFERKFRKSADATTDADLEQFIYKLSHIFPLLNLPKVGRVLGVDDVVYRPVATATKPRKKQGATTKPKAAAPVKEATPPPPSPSPPASPTIPEQPIQESSSSSSQLGPPQTMPNLEAMITKEAEIYQWNFEREEFDNDGIVHAQVCRKRDNPFSYWIVAATDEGVLLAHEICPETNPRWSHRMLTVTWNHMGGPSPSSWLFRFTEEEDYTTFMGMFIRAQWESLHRVPWTKMKVGVLR
jgi:VID27 PH-like domain/VID27 N-terminal region